MANLLGDTVSRAWQSKLRQPGVGAQHELMERTAALDYIDGISPASHIQSRVMCSPGDLLLLPVCLVSYTTVEKSRRWNSYPALFMST